MDKKCNSYQKETKLLCDIRKKIRKEARQSEHISAVYEYSTIEDFYKANEQSPMDIVFLEDTVDNCGLKATIREMEQIFLYFLGTSVKRAVYGYEYIRQHII